QRRKAKKDQDCKQYSQSFHMFPIMLFYHALLSVLLCITIAHNYLAKKAPAPQSVNLSFREKISISVINSDLLNPYAAAHSPGSFQFFVLRTFPNICQLLIYVYQATYTATLLFPSPFGGLLCYGKIFSDTPQSLL